SAGNHAQGVAYHARRLGIPATIVMPEGTPFTKIERTAAHGASVVLRGAGLSEAHREAAALAAERGLTFVHPYDDTAIIAGQGIAEGIAVKDPGKLTRAICAALVADILLVSESALERAIAMLLDSQKLVVEGAGAAGLAALLSDPERFRGRKVALVLCGGNI